MIEMLTIWFRKKNWFYGIYLFLASPVRLNNSGKFLLFYFWTYETNMFWILINVTIKFDAYTHSARTETIQKMQPIRSTAQAILNYYHQLLHESTMNAQSRRMNDGRTRCSAVEHRMNNTLKSIGNRKRAAIVEHIWGSAHSQSPHICVLVLQTQTAYERCSKV